MVVGKVFYTGDNRLQFRISLIEYSVNSTTDGRACDNRGESGWRRGCFLHLGTVTEIDMVQVVGDSSVIGGVLVGRGVDDVVVLVTEQSCLEVVSVGAGTDWCGRNSGSCGAVSVVGLSGAVVGNGSDEDAIDELVCENFSSVLPKLSVADLGGGGPEFGSLVSSGLGLVAIGEDAVHGKSVGSIQGIDNALMTDTGLIDAVIVDVGAASELLVGIEFSAGGSDFDDVTNFFHGGLLYGKDGV